MLLGVDVGTGGTRAVLIDRMGTVLASFASDHAPSISAGRNRSRRTGGGRRVRPLRGRWRRASLRALRLKRLA